VTRRIFRWYCRRSIPGPSRSRAGYWRSVGTRRIFRDWLAQGRAWLAPLLLDVGCGTGAFAAEVAGLGCVTAVDLSPEAIAFSHRRSLDGLCVRSSHDVLRGFPDAVRLAVPPGTR